MYELEYVFLHKTIAYFENEAILFPTIYAKVQKWQLDGFQYFFINSI